MSETFKLILFERELETSGKSTGIGSTVLAIKEQGGLLLPDYWIASVFVAIFWISTVEDINLEKEVK